eukprot:g18344.t1
MPSVSSDPGRSPNVASLDRPSAGVEPFARGRITIDEWRNTSAERVVALDDVTDRVELKPMTIAASRRLADKLFADMKPR